MQQGHAPCAQVVYQCGVKIRPVHQAFGIRIPHSTIPHGVSPDGFGNGLQGMMQAIFMQCLADPRGNTLSHRIATLLADHGDGITQASQPQRGGNTRRPATKHYNMGAHDATTPGSGARRSGPR